MKQVSRLAGGVVAGLVVCAAAGAWSLAIQLGRAHYADQVRRAQALLDARTGAHWDHRALVAANVSFLLLLITAALFITWHYRMLRQLERTLSEPLRHSAGWAIGGWFVPLLNLVRPKQMVNDTWRATTPPGTPPRWVPLSFQAWWALWVLSEVVTGVGTNMQTHNLDQVVTASNVLAAGDALTVAAAVLAVVVVIKLDRRAALVPRPVPLEAVPGMMLFNPPPGWPAQPPGWQPPPGWEPDPSWPPAPAGWTFWVPRAERWLAGLDAPSEEGQNRGGSK